MKYLKLFKKLSDYEAFKSGLDWITPNVSYIVGNNSLIYKKYIEPYLTFETIEDSTFKLTRNDCEYSLDEGETWVSLAAGTNTPTVPAGSRILFKATNPTISSDYGIGTFSSTGKFNIEGNIMSLLYGDNFEGQVDLTGKDYVFYELFSGCTNVVEAHNLILPATTLAERCYELMFDCCSSLTTAPKLPATTLASECYYGMFWDCTSLTTAPELPATTLADNCYYNMFSYCSSLTTAPALPATTLANKCYQYMFRSCTSLTTAPELPATTLADSCYCYMFNGCSSLTTAPSILPATTLAYDCYSFMFKDCTGLTTAPELPATTLTIYCYYYMFNGCSNLNNIVMLATNISTSSCLSGWVNNVASTGTFVKHKNMTSLPSGKNGIPNGWTVEDYQE